MSPEQASSKIGKSVGEKLRAARLAQHYTQSQLAAPDFSVSYISAIERGQISSFPAGTRNSSDSSWLIFNTTSA